MITALSDEGTLRAFLAQDPVANLFLVGILDEHGVAGRPGGPPVAFLGVSDEAGTLQGVTYVAHEGRLVVPSLRTRAAATELGNFLAGKVNLKSALGERDAVDGMWRAYGGGARPRLYRAQRLFQITPDDMGPFVTQQLRLATLDDLDAVVKAGAALHREDLGVDPLVVDADGFRRRCAERISQGRTHVMFEGKHLAFKADVGTRCRLGAQVEGVFTDPVYRRQGLGTLCMGQLCRSLLSGLPRVTLHVNESNDAAIGLYKKVGFIAARPFRLVAVE